MAKLKVRLQPENQLTMRVLNRDNVMQQRRAYRPDVDPDLIEAGTPHTLEYSWDAAFAQIQQEGGHVADILAILANEVALHIAPEYEPEDVEVEIVPKPQPKL